MLRDETNMLLCISRIYLQHSAHILALQAENRIRRLTYCILRADQKSSKTVLCTRKDKFIKIVQYQLVKVSFELSNVRFNISLETAWLDFSEFIH